MGSQRTHGKQVVTPVVSITSNTPDLMTAVVCSGLVIDAAEADTTFEALSGGLNLHSFIFSARGMS